MIMIMMAMLITKCNSVDSGLNLEIASFLQYSNHANCSVGGAGGYWASSKP